MLVFGLFLAIRWCSWLDWAIDEFNVMSVASSKDKLAAQVLTDGTEFLRFLTTFNANVSASGFQPSSDIQQYYYYLQSLLSNIYSTEPASLSEAYFCFLRTELGMQDPVPHLKAFPPYAARFGQLVALLQNILPDIDSFAKDMFLGHPYVAYLATDAQVCFHYELQTRSALWPVLESYYMALLSVDTSLQKPGPTFYDRAFYEVLAGPVESPAIESKHATDILTVAISSPGVPTHTVNVPSEPVSEEPEPAVLGSSPEASLPEADTVHECSHEAPPSESSEFWSLDSDPSTQASLSADDANTRDGNSAGLAQSSSSVADVLAVLEATSKYDSRVRILQCVSADLLSEDHFREFSLFRAAYALCDTAGLFALCVNGLRQTQPVDLDLADLHLVLDPSLAVYYQALGARPDYTALTKAFHAHTGLLADSVPDAGPFPSAAFDRSAHFYSTANRVFPAFVMATLLLTVCALPIALYFQNAEWTAKPNIDMTKH